MGLGLGLGFVTYGFLSDCLSLLKRLGRQCGEWGACAAACSLLAVTNLQHPHCQTDSWQGS